MIKALKKLNRRCKELPNKDHAMCRKRKIYWGPGCLADSLRFRVQQFG
jgi:hypothetical protein